MKKATTSKEEAILVECPKCGVAANESCLLPNGQSGRKSLHIERHISAIDNGARVRYINGARVFYEDEEEGFAA